jgi:hypothetical protein
MGPQNHQSIGAELLVVSGISGTVFVNGYAKAVKLITAAWLLVIGALDQEAA